MKSVLNQALFKHRTSATDGFNSLCTIIHQLHVEGYYYGEVLRAQHPIGTFVLRFDKNLPTHEVHIDAAKFDPIFNKDNSARPVERTFDVGGQGFVVFYTGGNHTELRIKLNRRDERNMEVSYDTAQLTAGDIVVFRLSIPDVYSIRHATEKHSMVLSVRAADRGKYPAALGKSPPVNIRLTPRGFEPAQIEQWPLQALIIQNEIAGALRVESSDEDVHKSR